MCTGMQPSTGTFNGHEEENTSQVENALYIEQIEELVDGGAHLGIKAKQRKGDAELGLCDLQCAQESWCGKPTYAPPTYINATPTYISMQPQPMQPQPCRTPTVQPRA